MSRSKIGLMAVGFVLAVVVMEFLALKLGSFDFPIPDGPSQTAVAENPGQ